MWFNTWNFLICVMALSMCILTEQCYYFLLLHILTTDLNQREIKECSVSHSVAEQHPLLAEKDTFLKRRASNISPPPVQSLFYLFCIKIKLCILSQKGAASKKV